MPAKVRLGRTFGIPVRVDWSWFVALLLIGGGLAWQFARQLGAGGRIAPLHWLMGLAGAALLFACVLLHELSHAIVARSRGVPINGITLFLFGGVAEMTEEPTNAKQEFLLAVAGPMMSVILACWFWIASWAVGAYTSFDALAYFLQYVALLNIVLAAFNVLPGFPLDGGRILRAVLWHVTGNLKRATYISTRIGVGLGLLLIAYGVVIVLRGNLGGLWFGFIGFFLKEAAESGYRQVLLKRSLRGVTVDQVMSAPVTTVPVDLTLDRLVDDYFLRHRYKSFPVEDGGRMVGLVSLGDVKAVPRDRWPAVQVVQIMQADILDHCVGLEKDAGALLGEMVSHGFGRIPVCVEGRPVGMVSRRDIMELFRIRTDLGE